MNFKLIRANFERGTSKLFNSLGIKIKVNIIINLCNKFYKDKNIF